MIKSLFDDVLFMLGVASVSYGLWQHHQPAAFIFAGSVAMVVGILRAKNNRKSNKQ